MRLPRGTPLVVAVRVVRLAAYAVAGGFANGVERLLVGWAMQPHVVQVGG